MEEEELGIEELSKELQTGVLKKLKKNKKELAMCLDGDGVVIDNVEISKASHSVEVMEKDVVP